MTPVSMMLHGESRGVSRTMNLVIHFDAIYVGVLAFAFARLRTDAPNSRRRKNENTDERERT